jgi:hypothetical protein
MNSAVCSGVATCTEYLIFKYERAKAFKNRMRSVIVSLFATYYDSAIAVHEKSSDRL